VKESVRLLLLSMTILTLGDLSVHTAAAFPVSAGPWIAQIEFDGNRFFPERKLRRKINLRAGRREWLDTLQVLRDRERIITAYSEQGYPDAEVSWSISNLDSAVGNIKVRFQIQEGRRQFVRSLTFVGNRTLDVEDLREAIRLGEGQPFDPRKLGEDEYLIHLVYANRGYALAKVDHEVHRDSVGQTDLVYRIEEGPKVHFGKITVAGNEQTKGGFLIAQSGIHPGQVFSLERLGKGQRALLATDILNQASFLPSGLTPEGAIDLTLAVKEKSSRWFSAGVGYGASDQFRISGDWGHRNLWGLGKRLTLRNYGGFALVPKVRNVVVHSEVSLGDPALFSTLFRGSLTAYYEREAPASGAYRAQRWGSFVGLEREWTWPGTVTGEARYEKVTLSDTFTLFFPDSMKYRTTRSIGFRLRKDLRTPSQRVLQGVLLRLSEEYAGGVFGGDNNFVKTQGGGSAYLPLKGWISLSGRLEGGSVENLPDEAAVPIYERFFLGGASSLRGYPEQGLSPEDSTGKLLGGHRYILGTLEVRLRIGSHLGAAVFSDVGDVWLAEDRLSYRSLRPTAGGELHYFTPVGPVRAGYAWKLRPEAGKPKGAYYVASGFAF